MRPALDVFWETIRDWYNGMVGLAMMNFIWLVATLTVVLMPPVTAGLYVMTNSIGHGTGGRLEDMIAGAWEYAWLSYQWALVNVVAAIMFAVGFWFYGATETALGAVIQAIFTILIGLWLMVQFYVWPFLIEQEDKRLTIGLKNALFLTLANPIYTLLLISIVAVALAISVATVLPIAVFAATFISLLGNRAVIERLRTYGKLPGDDSVSEQNDFSGDKTL